MSKEILLLAKAHFNIEGENNWVRHGFVTYAEYDKNQELNVEKWQLNFQKR